MNHLSLLQHISPLSYCPVTPSYTFSLATEPAVSDLSYIFVSTLLNTTFSNVDAHFRLRSTGLSSQVADTPSGEMGVMLLKS